LAKLGWKKIKILYVNFISSLATLLGTLLVIFFLKESVIIYYLLSVAAGIFLYLGASDFLPQIKTSKKNSNMSVVSFLVGVIVMITVLSLVPHV